MTFTIEFGWWLVPAAITVALWAVSIIATMHVEKSPEGRGIIGIAYSGIATVIALLVWLICAVLT